jgi:arginine-tRNA-protein transferase
MIYLNQYVHRSTVTPPQLDHLLASGWRHFGTEFFRYSLVVEGGEIKQVVPLRIRLADFQLSASQRRILARNRDTRLEIRPTAIDRTRIDLFDRHKQRYANNIPDSLDNFLSPEPATVPCRNEELGVYLDQANGLGERLIAASFLDLGQQAASAVYAMFEPDQSSRSLGIYLILRGIDYAKERGLKYYYPGYAYREPSFYDYKKRFSALEAYDWQGSWRPYTQEENR